MAIPKPNERTGPLAGHVRRGRTLSPPIVATGVFNLNDWIRKDLADLLWPALVLADLGDDHVGRFVRWQQDILDALIPPSPSDTTDNSSVAEFIASCLDGRLTGLDRLVAEYPDAAATVRNAAMTRGLLSNAVVDALNVYSDRPAQWLSEADPSDDGSRVTLIRRAVYEAIKDGHREALIKCLSVWAQASARTLRVDQHMIDLLKTYPDDPDTVGLADSLIRASWGGSKARFEILDGDHFRDAERWASAFWTSNLTMSRCVRADDLRPAKEGTLGSTEDDQATRTATGSRAEPDTEGGSDDGVTVPLDHAAATPMPSAGAGLRDTAADLFSSYLEATENAPAPAVIPHLQEVHTGLVARAARDVIAALTAPDMWCAEHGSHINRMLVEIRIYLEWMSRQDPSIYQVFRDYGAGKAKLYARILDELPPEARQPGFDEGIADLRRLSHTNDLLDYRVVDTSDSFSGKGLRSMAQEADLLDLYRYAYQQTSGIAHSEWWSVEANAMEPCVNILHGGHLIPSLNLNPGGQVTFARTWVDMLRAVMSASLRILGTDRVTVDQAFKWLKHTTAEGSPPD